MAQTFNTSYSLRLNQIDKSINSFLKALEINPNAPFVMGKCLHHKMKICDWNNLTEGISICEFLFQNNIPATVPFEALVLFDNPEIQLISAKLTNDLKYKNILPVEKFSMKESKRVTGWHCSENFTKRPL